VGFWNSFQQPVCYFWNLQISFKNLSFFFLLLLFFLRWVLLPASLWF
jgi:hypothetical protein